MSFPVFRVCLSTWLATVFVATWVAADVPVDQAWQQMPRYEYGQDMGPLLAIDREVIRVMGSAEERAAVAARLVALLEDEATTAAARQYIFLQLRNIGTDAQVPILARFLLQPDSSEMARHALESIPGQASLQALRDAVDDLQGPLLAGVLGSLAIRQDRDSVNTLIPLAESDDAVVAVAAVRALGGIGGVQATEALQAMAADDDPPMHREVLVALLDCAASLVAGDRVEAAREIYESLAEVDQPVGIRRAALTALLDLQDQDASQTVLEWFGSRDRVQRQVAAARLTMLTDQQLDQLATQTEELPESAQVAILELMAIRGGVRALPRVLEAASSDQPRVRQAAIRSLGLIADARAIPVLLAKLAEDEPASSLAAQALTAMPREQVGPALLNALDQQPELRPAVVDVLNRLVYYEAIDPLIEIAASDDPAVYEVALDGLRGIADPDQYDVPRLLELLQRSTPGRHRDDVERTILIVCDKQPARADRAEPVLKALGDIDVSRSSLHLPLLGRLGGPQALKILDAALESEDAQVRDAAVRGICNWPDASVADRLMEIASAADHPGHRQRALRAYVRVVTLPSDREEQQTLEMLQSAMRLATRPEDQRLILTRAATVRTMAAVEWIAGHLDRPELAQAACASLVDLAHHRFLRHPNMDRFRPILERVSQISEDADVVGRAQRYLLGL